MGHSPDPSGGNVGDVRIKLDGDEAWAPAPGGSTQERPGRQFLGSLIDYPNKGSWDKASQIQYVRVFLAAGVEITSCEIFQGKGSGSNIRIGIYSQSDPGEGDHRQAAGQPQTRVAQTAATTLVVGNDLSFVSIALSSSYTVPTTGYYWIAMISTLTGLEVPTTQNMVYGQFVPRYTEQGSGTTLPSSAGTLATSAKGIGWVALTE